MPHHKFCLLCATIFLLLFLSPALAQTQSNQQSIETFAAALLEAKSEAECAALLQTEKQFVTFELRQVLYTRADKLYDQKQWQQALNAYQAARLVALRINDKAGLGASLYKIGLTYFALNRFNPALDYFQQSLTIKTELADKPAIASMQTRIFAKRYFVLN